MASSSPQISHVSWGQMTIDGIGSGKDFKLWPGGGREWDWNETNTRHPPGIQPEDSKELLEHGSETIVLSRGILLRLKTCKETLSLLEQKGMEVHTVETKKSATLYNKLASNGVAVGGLFHSTC